MTHRSLATKIHFIYHAFLPISNDIFCPCAIRSMITHINYCAGCKSSWVIEMNYGGLSSMEVKHCEEYWIFAPLEFRLDCDRLMLDILKGGRRESLPLSSSPCEF